MPWDIGKKYREEGNEVLSMRVSVALLSYDHGIIRMVIDVLKEILEKGTLEKFKVETGEISRFMKEFINDFHHEKEERFLFPAALRLDPSMGPEVSELIHDHAHVRDLLMRLVASEISAGSRFEEISREIIETMTSHIDREEKEVFPKIEALLTPAEDRAVYKSGQEFEDGRFGHGYVRASEKFAGSIQARVLGSDYFKRMASEPSSS
jgi:hemerythrin-like domain-containing protein